MIPFLDLKAQYAGLKREIATAIEGVLDSGQFALGPEVAAFEQAFADFCGVRHAVAVNSGTSALHLALLAAGVVPGDEVITVAFTFVATVAAIEYAGAHPVLVDVDPRDLTIDTAAVEAAITPRTRAIVPVHLHGQPADMGTLRDIARRHGLILIEDAAQAHGAEWQGQRVGSLGDMGCFSFYPGKNLGAYGEGGMVVTGDDALAHGLRLLRDWGSERKYEHVIKGYNYRMDAMQGAILRVKLGHLEAWNAARRENAARYARAFAGSQVRYPEATAGTLHAWHVYAIRTPHRARWMTALQGAGIGTAIHYPTPVHLVPAYRTPRYAPGAFPAAEQAACEVLSLPIYPELSEAQIDEVARNVLALARADEAGR